MKPQCEKCSDIGWLYEWAGKPVDQFCDCRAGASLKAARQKRALHDPTPTDWAGFRRIAEWYEARGGKVVTVEPPV